MGTLDTSRRLEEGPKEGVRSRSPKLRLIGSTISGEVLKNSMNRNPFNESPGIEKVNFYLYNTTRTLVETLPSLFVCPGSVLTLDQVSLYEVLAELTYFIDKKCYVNFWERDGIHRENKGSRWTFGWTRRSDTTFPDVCCAWRKGSTHNREKGNGPSSWLDIFTGLGSHVHRSDLNNYPTWQQHNQVVSESVPQPLVSTILSPRPRVMVPSVESKWWTQ